MLKQSELTDPSRGSGNQIVMKPFRLMTSAERYTVEDWMQKQSGLYRNQIASNSWGFPFIPLPYSRTGFRDDPRIAPSNVNETWLGHPIYWIDPKLTKFDPVAESESSWCIRMFYLIQSLGLWDENMQWVSRIADVDYKEVDLHTYHQVSSPASAFDQVKIMSADDMNVTIDQLIEMYSESMSKCAHALVLENESLISRQTEAYKMARVMISNQSDDSGSGIRALRADEPGSLWDVSVAPPIYKLLAAYKERVEQPQAKMSDLVPGIQATFEHLESVIVKMNDVSSTLTIPVLKSVNPNPEAFSYLASYIGVAVNVVADRNSGYDFTKRALETTSRDLRPTALSEVVSDAWNEFQNAWKRVFISVYNFERIQEGLEPFTSFAALEVHYNASRNKGHEVSNDELVRQFDTILGDIN